LPKVSLSEDRYQQIKHIFLPLTIPLAKKDWWKKLESPSSHLQQRCQELYLPGTYVSIDEKMVKF